MQVYYRFKPVINVIIGAIKKNKADFQSAELFR